MSKWSYLTFDYSFRHICSGKGCFHGHVCTYAYIIDGGSVHRRHWSETTGGTVSIFRLDNRFFESTRGRIVRLLRRAQHTVDELASELGLTNNAVRAHLASLERDGMVRTDGVRRVSGAGKPATIYEIDPELEPLLSRAYVPLLNAVLGSLGASLPPEQLREVMRDVGHRLAAAHHPLASDDFETRVRMAASVLEELGAEATVETSGDTITIRGCSCPVSSAVSERPEVCRALQTLLADLTGARVEERCDRSDRPRCCFELTESA